MQLEIQFGLALGVGLVLGGIFLGVRPAGLDLIVVVQHRPRRWLVVLRRHVDHETA